VRVNQNVTTFIVTCFSNALASLGGVYLSEATESFAVLHFIMNHIVCVNV